MRISQTTFRLLMAVLLVVGLTGCADQLTGTDEADGVLPGFPGKPPFEENPKGIDIAFNLYPDAVETDTEGEAKFQYIPARNELRYKVKFEDIEDVTQAHIHLGAPDENGPVVAFLLKFADSVTGPEEDAVTPRGALVEQGTITADDVIALDGFDGSLESLIAEMDAGNTYVNVHTVENPAGEVRGQIVLDDDEGED